MHRSFWLFEYFMTKTRAKFPKLIAIPLRVWYNQKVDTINRE